jgi:hypothetical protein
VETDDLKAGTFDRGRRVRASQRSYATVIACLTLVELSRELNAERQTLVIRSGHCDHRLRDSRRVPMIA